MANRLRKFWNILVDAGDDFLEDHATKLSASLAYYTLFSIGPLLLVVVTLLGFFYKKAYITDQIFDRMNSVAGSGTTAQLQSILINMSHQTNKTLLGVIGILVFIFGATGIFSEIQSSINYMWSIKAKPKRSWLKYITDRLLSLLLVIGMGFLMMITVLLNLLIDLLSGRLKPLLGDANTILLKASNFGLLFIVVALVFFVIFKVLPDARIHWKDALIGAVFTTILFLIGKFLISYYFFTLESNTHIHDIFFFLLFFNHFVINFTKIFKGSFFLSFFSFPNIFFSVFGTKIMQMIIESRPKEYKQAAS